MVNPSISVLMPAFNAENFIAESIESILRQTFRDFELIVSDDYSTDKTWGIIQDYKKKDGRIRMYRNKRNLYIAENRNILLGLAKGKYIAWQDADDISVPDRLQEQYEFMEKNPSVGIVGGYLDFVSKDGKKSIRKYDTEDYILRKKIFCFSPVAQPTAMVRRECFDKVGLYDPKYPPAEDIDMSFRIGAYYKFANLPQITLRYREHHASATFKQLKKIELSTLEIRGNNNGINGYRMTRFDYFYNLLQYITIFIIPSKLKVALFKLIRNTSRI